ncbi:MAG: hypothetical protein QM731_22315 [Chitinophagaceae bacterium]
MAKQLGRFKWERTIHCFTFYRVGNKWYLRQKSSLSRRRVKTSKRFVKTMENARRLGRGATLAAAVYKKLPESWKMFELYQQLTGLASQLLKEGKCVNDIRHALEQQLYDWGYRKDIDYPDIKLKKKKIVLRTPSQCRKIEERLMCECRRADVGNQKEAASLELRAASKSCIDDSRLTIHVSRHSSRLSRSRTRLFRSQIFTTRNLTPETRNSFPRAPV